MNKIARITFFMLFFLVAVRCDAQWSDTIRTLLRGTMYPTASFDSRNSFISSRRAHIWGVKLGVEYSGRLQFGIGYNKHDKNLGKEVYFPAAAGAPDSAYATLRLSYVSVYTRFVYYQSKRWKFSIIPIQLGVGNSRYEYTVLDEEKKISKRMVAIFEPGMSVSFKIFWWLGAGADIGYRFMLRDNPAIPENFNSPIYTFYANIYWGEIYKAVFPNTKLAKML